MPARVKWVVHNLVAHPLLVLWPRAGEWLHDHTIPDDEQPSESVSNMTTPVTVSAPSWQCAVCGTYVPYNVVHYCTRRL